MSVPLPTREEYDVWLSKGMVSQTYDQFMAGGDNLVEAIPIAPEQLGQRKKAPTHKPVKPKDMVTASFDWKSNTWFVPVHTWSIVNKMDYHRLIGSKGKQRHATCLCLGKFHHVLAQFADDGLWRSAALGGPMTVIVTLTRLCPSPKMDEDNYSTAMKYVRDAVAEMLGSDDSQRKNPYLKFEYGEEKHPKIGVKINLRFA